MKNLIFIALILLVIFLKASLFAQSVEIDGAIVYTLRQVKENRSNIFLYNGKTKTNNKLTQKGINLSPRWSPDGGKFIFSSYLRDEHKNSEIYIMDTDGQNQKRLTYTEGGNAIAPMWGVDGETIYLRSAVKGSGTEKVLYLKNTKKKNRKDIGDAIEIKPINNMKDFINVLREKLKQRYSLNELLPMNQSLLKWLEYKKVKFTILHSYDGKCMLFKYRNEGDIDLVDIFNGMQIRLKTNYPNTGHPAWSKDSKKIAYVNGYLENDINFVIYEVEKDTYQEIKVSKEPGMGCGGELSWSPDSKKIVYSCGVPYDESGEGKSWLYILDLETKKSMKFIEGSSPDWH